MLFTLIYHHVLPDIKFNGAVLEWAKHIKYLGIIIADKLIFEHQIVCLPN